MLSYYSGRMNKQFLLLPLLLLATSCAHAPATPETTSSVAAAELAFAQDAQTRTVNEAFLAVLASDAILFRPGPVNGPAYHAEHPTAADAFLRWAPSYAETSADGSLGITTGPYETGTRGQPPRGTGHFLSVWRNTAGKWQLVFDGGAPGPIELSVDSAMRSVRERRNTQRFAADTLSLLQAERQRAPAGFTPLRAVVAGSGDLGYVYGTDNTGQRSRGYARIYRRASSGEWQLVIDTLDPHVR